MSTIVIQGAAAPTPSTTTSSSSTSSASTTVNKKSANRFRRPIRKPELQLDKNELKKKLTPIQYRVTQEKFTERPYSGEYLRLNEHGIYCCVVCGMEIFSSETKYDSGCGWPAFYDTIDSDSLIQQTDLSHVGGNLLLLALNPDLARTEIQCSKCGAHIGHVFDDGPKPTGKRYCVNSVALKFKKSNGEIIDCDTLLNSSSSLSSAASATSPLSSQTPLQCCFRSNNKCNLNSNATKSLSPPPPSSTTTTLTANKDADVQQQQNSIPIKPLRQQQQQQSKQTKTKSLSPTVRPKSMIDGISPKTSATAAAATSTPTTAAVQPSSHARKVQMNREDFFKSSSSTAAAATTTTNKSINDIDDRLKNSPVQKQSLILNRTRRIASNFEQQQQQQQQDSTRNNDINNNPSTTPTPTTNVAHKTNNKLYNDVKSRYLDHLDSLSKKSVIKHTFSLSTKSKSSTLPSTTTSKVLESDL